MKNYTITPNTKFNSLEIAFTGKPDEATRTALKALGFRWNPKKSIWYGFAEIEEVEKALTGATVSKCTPKAADVPELVSLWERTKTDSIPEHEKYLSTREIAKLTREHMKERFPELKISCRIGKGGWASCNEVNFEFISGCYKKDSEAFEAIEEYVKAWLWSFNYDNSDSMTDYFDRGFYEEISSYNYVSVDPTFVQEWDIEDFNRELAKANAEAEAKAEAEYQAYLAEQKEREALWKEVQAREEADSKKILEHVEVVDVPEADQYVVSGEMLRGCGKECNISELMEHGGTDKQDAVIGREVHFSDVELYNTFCKMFLWDFDFLNSFGGVDTFDSRLQDVSFGALDPEQSETVKWHITNAVAVYVNHELMLVVDPSGFSYARYVYVVNDYTKRPLLDFKREEEAVHNGESFYVPAPVSEQSSQIEEGSQYTLIYEDPWTLCATMHHIKINKVFVDDYAQYKNVLYIDYTEKGRRKSFCQHFSDNDSVLLYPGYLNAAPESLSRRHISGNMYEVLNAGAGVHKFLKNVYDYFKQSGFAPVVNTLHF